MSSDAYIRNTTTEDITDLRTGESYKLVHHRSGLDLLLMPMEGYAQTYAMMSAKYGSINNCFRTSEKEDFVTVPDGIAHYLEHKLFENEDCDAFALYAKTGADANAFTGFERTSYLFSCTDNYLESLKILLDLVQNPFFTQENVDKERGIIGQEIKMSDDLPSRRAFMNLLRGMYSAHPVRIDIAGTQQSIAEITPDLLYKCYNAFYSFGNMTLAVAGRLDVDDVIKVCDECLKIAEPVKLERRFPHEPAEIVQKRIEEDFGVGVPMFEIGFKCPPLEGTELARAEITAGIMLTLLTEKSSELYERITGRELMQNELAHDVFCGDGYFALVLNGESEQPDEVLAEILSCAEKAAFEGFDERRVELAKKERYGALIQLMGYPEYWADNMTSSYFCGQNIFTVEKLLAEVTADDVNRAVRELISPDNCVISIMR